MEKMASVAKQKLDIDVEFVPVFVDCRITEAEGWRKFWKKVVKQQRAQESSVSRVSIVACVCGTKASLPRLFPCLEHRFELFDGFTT